MDVLLDDWDTANRTYPSSLMELIEHKEYELSKEEKDKVEEKDEKKYFMDKNENKIEVTEDGKRGKVDFKKGEK